MKPSLHHRWKKREKERRKEGKKEMGKTNENGRREK